MEETPYEVTDPKSGKRHALSRVELWRLTFAAAGSYCSEKTEGMVGEHRKGVFVRCMSVMARGVPTAEKAQQAVNIAKFSVDDFVERLEVKHAPLPFKRGIYSYEEVV